MLQLPTNISIYDYVPIRQKLGELILYNQEIIKQHKHNRVIEGHKIYYIYVEPIDQIVIIVESIDFSGKPPFGLKRLNAIVPIIGQILTEYVKENYNPT